MNEILFCPQCDSEKVRWVQIDPGPTRKSIDQAADEYIARLAAATAPQAFEQLVEQIEARNAESGKEPEPPKLGKMRLFCCCCGYGREFQALITP